MLHYTTFCSTEDDGEPFYQVLDNSHNEPGLTGKKEACEVRRLRVSPQEIVKARIRHIEMVMMYTTCISTRLPYQ